MLHSISRSEDFYSVVFMQNERAKKLQPPVLAIDVT